MAKKQKEWQLTELRGPFGYRREGYGIVVYLFLHDVDFDVLHLVTDEHYTEKVENEDGDEVTDFSQYDPSHLDSEMAGELEDTVTMSDLAGKIQGEGTAEAKLIAFIQQDVLGQNIPLIYADQESRDIVQLTDAQDVERVISSASDWVLFIREYDHVDDY